MARASLPPGFRFHPTDVELILYYLKRKVLGKRLVIDAITELDLYKFSPWDLPDKSCLRSRDLEWYFFCPKDKKYAQGARTNRATEIGYWKTTGRDRAIYNETQIVGMKKTLIFHLGRAPLGERTNWVMHEYRLAIKDWIDACISQDSHVLCKIFEKSGAGPKNGEQHGAPFNEEEWENDLVENSLAPLPLVDSSFPSIILDDEKNIVSKNSTLHLEKTCESPLQHPCQDVSSDTTRKNQPMLDNVDMDYIFALLEAENDPGLIGIDSMAKQNGTDQLNLTNMGDGNVLGQTLLRNDMAYVELDDFDSPMKYPVNDDGPKHIQYENSNNLEIYTGDDLTFSSENVGSIRLSDLDVPEKYPWEANSENFFPGDQFSCNTDVGLESFSFPYVPTETIHLNPASCSGSSASLVHKDSSALTCNLDVVSRASTSKVGSSGCVLHKNSGIVDNFDAASDFQDRSGFEGTSVSWYKDPKQTHGILLGRNGERVNTNSSRTSSRGEQHSGTWRLQHLLGSIAAPPASAAEFPMSKGNTVFTNHGGSSIHVRCGFNEEALSGKSGVVSGCSSGHPFVFLLLVITVLAWVLMFIVVVKLGGSAWKMMSFL